MGLPRKMTPRGSTRRHVARWSALALGVSVILPSVGCQVEYAGMTLPSGRYMHDDVQYFPSGPDFPWANTQAATQRARMRAMGIEPPPAGVIPQAMGTLPGVQQGGGRPTDVNVMPRPAMPPGIVPGGAVPMGPGPGAVPPPGPGLAPGAPAVPPGGAPAPGNVPAPGGAAGTVPAPPPANQP
jgi:hypothetical protein